jgi:hypothetical protein
MSNPKLTIKNPCDVPWDSMKPNAKGRYCDSCNKTVVNFSGMANEEIQDYLKKANGERVCGYFNSAQVEVKRPKHHLFLIELYYKIEQKFTIPYIKKIPLYCVVFCLFLVGCKSKVDSKTGKSIVKKNSNKDSREQPLTGVMLPPISEGESDKISEHKITATTKTECSEGVTVGITIPEIAEPEIVDEYIPEIEKIDTIKQDSITSIMIGKVANPKIINNLKGKIKKKGS